MVKMNISKMMGLQNPVSYSGPLIYENQRRVTYYHGEKSDVQRKMLKYFGRILDEEELAGLAGAPKNALVRIGADENGLTLETTEPIELGLTAFFRILPQSPDVSQQNISIPQKLYPDETVFPDETFYQSEISCPNETIYQNETFSANRTSSSNTASSFTQTFMPSPRFSNKAASNRSQEKEEKTSENRSLEKGEKTSKNQLVLKLDCFHILRREKQNQGVGTECFRQMLVSAQHLLLRQIETQTALKTDENGYYTWPRFGFNSKLPWMIFPSLISEVERRRAEGKPSLDFFSKNNRRFCLNLNSQTIPKNEPMPEHSIEKLFEYSSGFSLYTASPLSVLDIMQHDWGRRWWKKNGIGLHLIFDLSPESRSLHVFHDYLAARNDQKNRNQK